MKKLRVVLGVVAALVAGCVGGGKPAYEPVATFDLARYLGTWYEIARFPHRFERGLERVSATYSLTDGGAIRVQNEGYDAEGTHKTAIGRAKPADASGRGFLRVSFFGPFWGDYIIIDLDPEYRWVLVTSSPDYLWILAREKTLDPAVYDALVAKAAKLGLDTSKLEKVAQE